MLIVYKQRVRIPRNVTASSYRSSLSQLSS